jgi:G3E family GTPase
MPREHSLPTPQSEDDEKALSNAWDRLLYTLGSPPTDEEKSTNKWTGIQRGQEVGSTLPRMQLDKGARQIPVTVLSGFLGAGKTTLLCKLLTESQLNILAIVNDVSTINIDAALIRTSSAETIQLENGCACCVLNSDLQLALAEIGSREITPDAIVVEASGLSDPMGIAQAVANNETTVLDGIITLLDVNTMQAHLDDPFTAPLLERQISAAHLIFLSKTRPLDDINAIQSTVGNFAPGRSVIALDTIGDGIVEIVLGASMRGARPEPVTLDHDYSGFGSSIIDWPAAPGADSFFAILDRIPDSVYRIKGWVTLKEKSNLTRYEVQAAGSSWRVNACSEAPEIQALVVIGKNQHVEFLEFCQLLKDLQ